MPETSCMKGTSVHIKNMSIKQLCNRKVRDFAMAFRARKVSGAFEKRAPGHDLSTYRDESVVIYLLQNWGGGEGDTLSYGLHRYVPPDRIGSLKFLILKKGIIFVPVCIVFAV